MGEIKTLKPILVEHPFFKDLDEKHIDILVGCCSNVRFEPGEMITRSGETADKFYIVRQGRVAIEITPPGRGAIIVETVADGDVLGWSWLFPPYKWNLDSRPLETVRALSLDGKCLRGKMEKDHDLGYALYTRFAKLMLGRIRAMREQLIASV